jgi:hypothetical protein
MTRVSGPGEARCRARTAARATMAHPSATLQVRMVHDCALGRRIEAGHHSGLAPMNVILIIGTVGVLGVLALSIVAILDVLAGNGRRSRARQRRGHRTQRERENRPVSHVSNRTTD